MKEFIAAITNSDKNGQEVPVYVGDDVSIGETISLVPQHSGLVGYNAEIVSFSGNGWAWARVEKAAREY